MQLPAAEDARADDDLTQNAQRSADAVIHRF